MMTRGWARGSWRDQVGTTTLEYALLLALVALTSLASYRALGLSTAESTRGVNQQITTVDQPQTSVTNGGTGAPAAPSNG